MTPNEESQILACLLRIELLLTRRLPRQTPRSNVGGTGSIPLRDIVTAWAEICPTLDRPSQLTPQRRTALRSLWRRFEKIEGGPMEGIKGLFEIVAESDFLCGRARGVTWRADMWWVIEPAHLASILEGRYRNEIRSPLGGNR